MRPFRCGCLKTWMSPWSTSQSYTPAMRALAGFEMSTICIPFSYEPAMAWRRPPSVANSMSVP